MKKIILVLALTIAIFGLTGCEKVNGKYKEGTYYGTIEIENGGSKYIVSSIIYVDKTGSIKSCFIDETYNKEGINSTKKALGDKYGMKETSKNKGVIPDGAEWYEQIAVIEKKVVEEQGLDWVKWKDEEKTKLDAISGVTISANSYISVVSKTLEQAK